MSLPVFAQSHRAFALSPFRHETPAFLLSREALPFRLKAGVELWQALPKVFQTALEEVFGEKEFLRHLAGFHAIAAFAGEDNEFAHYVASRKVDARVWFAVSLLLRHAHCLAELYVGRERIEHEVQRAAQHRADTLDAVARGA